MANLLADVRDHLLERQELRDLVGDRIYPDTLPQNVELPALLIEIESDLPGHLIAAASTLRQAELTATGVARTRRETNLIAYQLDQTAVLAGFRGLMGGGDTTHVRGVIRTNQIASVVAPPPGSELWEHRLTSFYRLDYSIPP